MGLTLQMSSGLVTVLGLATDLLVTVVLWAGPCPSLGLDVHVCKMGSGHGTFASLSLERQHPSWVHVGDLRKDSRKATVGDLYLLYCSRARREQPCPGPNT